jgi:hypothetical protein
MIRAAVAKEVGVGNPAEETSRHPNQKYLHFPTSHTTIQPPPALEVKELEKKVREFDLDDKPSRVALSACR